MLEIKTRIYILRGTDCKVSLFYGLNGKVYCFCISKKWFFIFILYHFFKKLNDIVSVKCGEQQAQSTLIKVFPLEACQETKNCFHFYSSLLVGCLLLILWFSESSLSSSMNVPRMLPTPCIWNLFFFLSRFRILINLLKLVDYTRQFFNQHDRVISCQIVQFGNITVLSYVSAFGHIQIKVIFSVSVKFDVQPIVGIIHYTGQESEIVNFEVSVCQTTLSRKGTLINRC